MRVSELLMIKGLECCRFSVIFFILLSQCVLENCKTVFISFFVVVH